MIAKGNINKFKLFASFVFFLFFNNNFLFSQEVKTFKDLYEKPFFVELDILSIGYTNNFSTYYQYNEDVNNHYLNHFKDHLLIKDNNTNERSKTITNSNSIIFINKYFFEINFNQTCCDSPLLLSNKNAKSSSYHAINKLFKFNHLILGIGPVLLNDHTEFYQSNSGGYYYNQSAYFFFLTIKEDSYCYGLGINFNIRYIFEKFQLAFYITGGKSTGKEWRRVELNGGFSSQFTTYEYNKTVFNKIIIPLHIKAEYQYLMSSHWSFFLGISSNLSTIKNEPRTSSTLYTQPINGLIDKIIYDQLSRKKYTEFDSQIFFGIKAFIHFTKEE